MRREVCGGIHHAAGRRLDLEQAQHTRAGCHVNAGAPRGEDGTRRSGYAALEWSRLPNAQAPAAVLATCFGLAVLLFFFASRKASKQAMTWPSVPGRIVSSGVEAIAKREDGRTTTSYKAAVEFDYQVHGIDYHSRQINLGIALSGSRASAEKVAARYPEGSTVDVHYDPANPTNAALENPTGYSWLLLAVALACFGIAVYASGVFK